MPESKAPAARSRGFLVRLPPMDAFESVVGSILREDGYWIWPSFKVELTKPEKRRIGKHSSPRWEIDLVAYKASTNRILAVECKSYLNSTGVQCCSFQPDGLFAHRYKMFNDAKLRRVVLSGLARQMVDKGLCRRDPKVQLCLAAGRIRNATDRAILAKHFRRKRWELWDDEWLRTRLKDLARGGYDNQVASVVAKLLVTKTST
jgi:hypothetical protein